MAHGQTWDDVSMEVRGRRVHYVQRPGRGTILFLHGLYGDHAHFRDAFTSPHLEGWGLAALDLPGFGTSEVAEGPILEAFVEAADAVLERHAPHGAALIVAHSMASSAACRLARSCVGLVLIEGNIVAGHLQVSDRIVAMTREAYEAEFERLAARAEVMLKFETRVASADDRRYFAASYRRCRVEAAWAAAHVINSDVRDGRVLAALRSWPHQLCVIYGGASRFSASVGSLRAELPRATFVQVADAGHFPMLDRPDAVYGPIGKLARDTLPSCC